MAARAAARAAHTHQLEDDLIHDPNSHVGGVSTRRQSSLYGAPVFHQVNLKLNFNHIFPIPEITTLPVHHKKAARTEEREQQLRRRRAQEEMLSVIQEEETLSGRPYQSDTSRRHVMESMLEQRNEALQSIHGQEEAGTTPETKQQYILQEGEWALGRPVPGRNGPIGKFRNFLGAVVNYGPVSFVVAVLIIANAIILGALTFDLPHDAKVALETIDMVLLYLFTIEYCSQAIYLGLALFQNGFLVWDGLITISSWVFASGSLDGLQAFRVFRVYAIVSRWAPLRNLCLAIGSIVPRMGTIWLALSIFFYTFSVLYTALYHDLYDEGYLSYDYFGRLDRTFLTLFQMMTLDSWTDLVREVIEARPWALVGFISWVIITSFFVLNLMIAVICESLIELRNIEGKLQTQIFLRQNQNAMANQTEEIVRETQQVAVLQQEMLNNQLQMQKALKELVDFLNEDDDDNDNDDNDNEPSVVRGKNRLSHELQEEDAPAVFAPTPKPRGPGPDLS
jgi:phage-related holin